MFTRDGQELLAAHSPNELRCSQRLIRPCMVRDAVRLCTHIATVEAARNSEWRSRCRPCSRYLKRSFGRVGRADGRSILQQRRHRRAVSFRRYDCAILVQEAQGMQIAMINHISNRGARKAATHLKAVSFAAVLLALICAGFERPASAQARIAAGSGLEAAALPQVQTADGIVQGAVDSSGIRSFKGIPYAQPPINDLRWREPQPVAKWDYGPPRPPSSPCARCSCIRIPISFSGRWG